MSQMFLSNVQDLQCIEAVGDCLQEGIQSICKICTALSNAHVDLNTGRCIDYEPIYNHIKNAEKCLKTSENMIKEKLENLNKSMESLEEEKNRIEQEKNEKTLAINKLCKDKSCDEEILHQSKRALEQTERNLDLGKEALKKEEARRHSGQSLTIAGSVMLVLPIVGLIAGPIMICEGERGRRDATKGIMAAEEEIRKDESQVREYRVKVSDYQYKISEVQKEINTTNKILKNIQEDIERLKQHLVVTADIQNTVRRAVHLVSVLSGRVTVLQMQTQRFIMLEPVVNVMKEVMKAAINITENQFLYSEGLPGLINTLRENYGKLLTVCNSLTGDS